MLPGLLCAPTSAFPAAENAVRPVTPDASPEAVELLKFLHHISGRHTLSGQHNFPADKDKHALAVLLLDCYQEFKQSYYEDLLRLAKGKPIALAEVGAPPPLTVLEAQPKWTCWMTWAGMGGRGDAATRSAAVVNAPHAWSLSDSDYRKAIAPIRLASGLPAEPPVPAAP